MNRRQASLICIVLLLAGCVVRADDWPKWRGPDGDAITKEKDLLQSWPDSGLTQLWSADVGEGFSSPVAKDGKVYLLSAKGTSETLTAYDAGTGAVVWSQDGGAVWTGDYHGARATPTIDGDRIYTFSGAGELICRNLANGKPIWDLDVMKETASQPLHWGTASTPLVTDKWIYVQGGKPTGPICVEIDKQTGKIAWKSEAQGTSGYAPPMLLKAQDQSILIIFTGATIYGLDPETGKTLFSEPWKTPNEVNAATPIFRDGKLFVTSGYGKGCGLFEVSPTGLTSVWKNKEISGKFSTPIYDHGVLYANTSDAHGGVLVCLDWNTGKEVWKIDEEKYKLGMGGSLIRFDDKLIGLSDKGTLMLFDATPEKGDSVAEFDTGLGGTPQVWSSPVIYDHKLYIKGLTKLVCYDLSAKAHAEGPMYSPSLSPSPCTQGEGRGEGSLASGVQNPHPNPLPEYRERGQESAPVYLDILNASPPATPPPSSAPAAFPAVLPGAAAAGAAPSTRPLPPPLGVDDRMQALGVPATLPATTPYVAPNWQNPLDCPAFHNGGPLLGVASDILLPTTQRWSVQVGDDDDGVEATPAVVGDVVYVPDMSGTLTALRLADGSVLWKYKATDGLSTSPLVVDGRVFVGDLGGMLHAVDAATGKKLWTYDSGATIHSSPNYTGKGVLFANDNGHIACLNPADGKELWARDLGQRINSALAVRGSLAFAAGCDAQIHAIDLEDGSESYSTDLGALTGASPAVMSDRIAVGLDGGHVVCVALDGSKQLWASDAVQNGAMSYASPAIDGGLVIIGARDRIVHALDVNTGEEKWLFETKGDVNASPVISAGRVYVGSKDRNLYALDLKTGQKLWEFMAPHPIIAGPAIARGVLILADGGGMVYCFEGSK